MTDPSTLTNDHLNRAVAEARGWKAMVRCPHVEGGERDATPEDAWRDLVWYAPDGVRWMPPYPASNILDAWPLVEEMCAAGRDVVVSIGSSNLALVGVMASDSEWLITSSPRGDAAPRAITIAWLRWRRQQGA